ncbi:MAG: hypothetical protein KAW00_00545 [Dehalococcoidia bacterium]|nr:hypothetical protein [Dehalococcoidia bacterium]
MGFEDEARELGSLVFVAVYPGNKKGICDYFHGEYGIDAGIKYDKLTEISKLVDDLAGKAPNRPFVGYEINDIESSMVVSWYKNSHGCYSTETTLILPKFVGHRETRIVMGKKSGLDSVAIWADKLGIELANEEMGEILKQVKQRSYDLKRSLSKEEFREIALNVKAGNVASPPFGFGAQQKVFKTE